MTTAQAKRIDVLEKGEKATVGNLPQVLPDSVPDSHLQQLRQRGIEAYRLSAFVQRCV